MRPKSNVQIVPRSGNDIPYPNCLLVDPQRDPANNSILATVDHFLQKPSDNGLPWTIHNISEKPLPLNAALDMASRYAEANGIPIIMVNEEGMMSTEAEKSRTDTMAIDMTMGNKIPGKSGDDR